MSALEGANLPGATSLIEELDNKVLVILRDGRHFAGHLASLDQFSNIVLEDCVERSFAGKLMMETPHGCMVVRSDNIVMVARIDEAKEASGGSMKKVEPEEFVAEAERLIAADAPLDGTDASFWDFDQ